MSSEYPQGNWMERRKAPCSAQFFSQVFSICGWLSPQTQNLQILVGTSVCAGFQEKRWSVSVTLACHRQGTVAARLLLRAALGVRRLCSALLAFKTSALLTVCRTTTFLPDLYQSSRPLPVEAGLAAPRGTVVSQQEADSPDQ